MALLSGNLWGEAQKPTFFSISLPSLAGVGQRLHLEITLRSANGWLGCVPVWLWSGLSTVQNPPALVQRGLQKVHPPLWPDESLQTKDTVNSAFCLAPSPSCTPIHINPQPEFATYWVQMRTTHPPSVNQGDQELCGPQSCSSQHSRALCVQQITGVLSDTAPPFVKWE